MRLYFLTKKSLKASSHDSKLGFEEGSYSMTLLAVSTGLSSRPEGAGGAGGAQILADQFTLSQPGRSDYTHRIFRPSYGPVSSSHSRVAFASSSSSSAKHCPFETTEQSLRVGASQSTHIDKDRV